MSQISETHYRVRGMTCGGCERSVRETIERLDGVQSAVTDRADGTLVVRGAVGAHEIDRALQAAGYALVADVNGVEA